MQELWVYPQVSPSLFRNCLGFTLNSFTPFPRRQVNTAFIYRYYRAYSAVLHVVTPALGKFVFPSTYSTLLVSCSHLVLTINAKLTPLAFFRTKNTLWEAISPLFNGKRSGTCGEL